MQASFWKTVSVVGVIGIGSLVTLEVQNRLSRLDSAADKSTDAPLRGLVAQSGEQSLTAATTTSEFDRAIESFDNDAQGFDVTEPPLNETMTSADEQLHSEPVPPGDFTPPIDTTVRSDQIAPDGNPFAPMQTQVAPAAAAQFGDRHPLAVERAGFVEEPAFADDVTSVMPSSTSASDDQPGVLRPTPNVVEEDSANSSFPLFGAAADAQGVLDGEREVTTEQSADLAVPAQKKTDQFLFFSQEESGTVGTTPTETVTLPQPATAPFYGAVEPQLKPAPADEPPRSLNDEVPMFDLEPENQPFGGQPEAVAPTGQQDNPFPGLPAPTDPEATDTFSDSRPAPPALVPTPREPSTRPVPVFSNDSDAGLDIPGSITVDSAPQTTAPGDDSALPFAEDLPAPNGDLQTVPELPATSPLKLPKPSFTTESENTIPGTNNSFPNSGYPQTPDSAERFPADRPGDALDARPFSRPFEETPPLTSPGQSDLSPRTFNAQPSAATPGRVSTRDEVRQNTAADIQVISGVMRPNLVLQKTAPKNASVGSPLEYSIFVRNEGDATAYEVIVEDEVPGSVQVDGARPQSDFDRSTGKLIWHYDVIEPGDTEEIKVQVTPTGEGTLDGVASVKFKSRVQATTVVTAPRLRLQMTGPKEVKLGEEVTYRYVITNDGTGEARDVFLRTLLPDGGGFSHPQGRDLEYEIQSMRPGEQREIILSVVAGEPGEHQTDAELTATGTSSEQAVWQTNVVGAQLQIVRRGPKRRYVGRVGVYENVVTNETNFDATDAKVVELVPDGMRFISADNGGRYDADTSSVTWAIARIGAGRQKLLQIELMPTSAGSRESTVTILENAGFRSDDYVSTTVVEDLHNVSADISQLGGPVAMGETFGFTVTIDNRGTADATDVELTIDVPEEIQVVGAGSSSVQAKLLAGNVVQYNVIVRIQPGKEQAFQIKMTGARPVSNGVVKAKVRYRQMQEPLVVSESVTVYRDDI
ncbi:MAG: hypothetical protein P8K08_07110 [Fuerstiella sp.]|jgi:uncharacterized repeat protein (TIGR01451 family)|nr:hypothetical protein [Fuerstiella sp.]